MVIALLFLALLRPLAESEDQGATDRAPPIPAQEKRRFHWKPALIQSTVFLGVQHASRMAQDKTRHELGGPFFSDYFESVSNIRTWRDEDGIPTNYLGHPMMGAITGYFQVFNDPRGQRIEFDLKSKQYWNSRLKAMAWSAVYSAQYEIGTISEASIGNVGKRPPTMAVVDLVMTPVGGLGLMLLEDYLDKRFISRWEGGGGVKARIYRIVLNPNRAVANLFRWKRPSHRDNRPL